MREILQKMESSRVLVVGDLILDAYHWGCVDRISPEAPVPVVRFQEETNVPGGAANVARNLAELKVPVSLIGVVGDDVSGRTLKAILREQGVDISSMLMCPNYQTSTKTRVIAQRQQLLRVDREEMLKWTPELFEAIKNAIAREISCSQAVIVGDYNKGGVTQALLDFLKEECAKRGIWLSLDPKPSHTLNLSGVKLITPNRKEAFELVGMTDEHSGAFSSPLEDVSLCNVARILLERLAPANVLITLGEQGMLLCCPNEPLLHIPTFARQVFDVSGAGDTVIATITAAIAAGASMSEAARLSNHAAGIVVAKLGTATVSPQEILDSLQHSRN